MNRRELLGTLVAASLPIPVAAAAEEKEALQTFQRYNRELDRWEPVNGFDVKTGDIIYNPVNGATMQVTCNEPENRQFYGHSQIEPGIIKTFPRG